MKPNFTFLLLTAFFALAFTSVIAQPSLGDYRSVNASGGGNWSDISKWERYDGSAWVSAVLAPSSSDGVITISANDNIIVNTNVTADQLVIETNASLSVNVNPFNLTLNDGPGNDLVVNGTLLLRSLNTISGPGNIVVNGTFNWYSGSLSAPTTTSSGAVVNLDLNFNKDLNANFTNNGTFNWIRGASAGGIYFNNAVFTNNGTINELFLGDGGFSDVSGTNAFINNGVFKKTTTFVFYNTNVPFTNNGTIKGIGSLSFSGTVVNNGDVAPGNSPGILASNSPLLNGQTATVSIEVLDGTGAGTGHDRLDLTGSVDLSTLSLHVSENTSAPLQAYTILTTSGTFSGSFASVNMPSAYSIAYNPTSVVITKNVVTLPAVWGDFTAIAKSNKIELNWTTLQEINTSYFAVEYSKDGKNYKKLTDIPAKGNSGLQNNYKYIHTTPDINNSNFYRIALYDADGSKSYSAVRLVKFAENKLKLLVATPNPVQSTLNLYAQEKLEIRLTDMNGRIVKEQTLSAGNNKLDASSLHPGIYIINTYKNGQLVESDKIIKQ